MALVVVVFPPSEEAKPWARLAVLLSGMEAHALRHCLAARHQALTCRTDPPTPNRPVRKVRTVDTKPDDAPVRVPIQIHVEKRERICNEAKPMSRILIPSGEQRLDRLFEASCGQLRMDDGRRAHPPPPFFFVMDST